MGAGVHSSGVVDVSKKVRQSGGYMYGDGPAWLESLMDKVDATPTWLLYVVYFVGSVLLFGCVCVLTVQVLNCLHGHGFHITIQ